MPRIGVNWGSSPDLSGPMSSLGASLAGAMGGGAGGSRAARDAAYIESLNRRNSVYDQQAAKIAAEAAAKQAEAAEAQRQIELRRKGGTAFADELVTTLPKPVADVEAPAPGPGKFGGYGPQPAIVDPIKQQEYDQRAERYRTMGPAMFESGKSFKDYAEGLNTAIPRPVPVEEQKPIFDTDKTVRMVPDANEPSGYKRVPVGTVPGPQGAPAGKAAGKPTAENLKAAGFVPRLEDANNIMSDPKVAAASQSLKDRALDYIPGIGRFFQSEDFKRLSDAEKDMVTAVLRDESGATIQDSEFVRDAEKYFPRYGDTPQILADKANRRRIQIEAMKMKAGPALQPSAAPEATGSVTTAPDRATLEAEAQAAIDAGADPAAVHARLQKLLGGQ